MNQDNFKPIQPIGKPSAKPPVASQASQPPADPVNRIISELAMSRNLTEALIDKIDALDKRGIPATAQDLEKVLEKARSGVKHTVDSQEVAAALAPLLQTSTQAAVYKINQAADQAAHRWVNRIGFTSPKAAAFLLGIPILVLLVVVWFASRYYERAETASTELAKHQRFANWVDSTHHQVFVDYNEFAATGSVKPAAVKGGKKGNRGKK